MLRGTPLRLAKVRGVFHGSGAPKIIRSMRFQT